MLPSSFSIMPKRGRAQLFAEAATVFNNGFSDGNGMLLLQTIALPLAIWAKPICVALALFWLLYRAGQVLYKPLDELAALLGFEIPLTPTVDLASVKADGAIIHWALPPKQKQKNSLKFEVWLNGGLVDSVSIHETAVQITGLQPGTFYVVRVALVNNLEFGSKSDPIRFRTRPAVSGDYFVFATDGHDTDHDGNNDAVPRVRPYRALKDITPSSPTSVSMERESSSGVGSRRSLTGRRSSPGMVGASVKHDPPADDSEPPEGAETISQLTVRLDDLRVETDQVNKLAEQEEIEELRQKDELTKERDRLRAEVADKEKASKTLKKDVNLLERQNTAAQNERNKQERLLQSKKQERQKLKDDAVRWKRETEQMKADVERMKLEKVKHIESNAKEKDTLRAKLAEETHKTRLVDDEIKDKINETKRVERIVKSSTPNSVEPEVNLVEQFQKDAEDDRQYNAHRNAMLLEYQNLYQRLEDAKRFYSEHHRFLETLRTEQRRQDDLTQLNSPPASSERPLRRGDSQRSRQAPSRHSTSDSPRMAAFPPVSQSPFTNSIATAPTGFNTTGFMNIRSGMTITQPTDDINMSEEDKERLTGGAAMSPGVETDLLPAGLFNTSDERKDTRHPQQVTVLPGLGSLPGLGGLTGSAPPLPPPAQQQELFNPGPASPNSVSSRSPSVFASPQASQNNLYIGSP